MISRSARTNLLPHDVTPLDVACPTTTLEPSRVECEKDAESSRKDPLTKDKSRSYSSGEPRRESASLFSSQRVAFRRIDFRLMFPGADNEVNLWVIYEFAGIGLINRDKEKIYISDVDEVDAGSTK